MAIRLALPVFAVALAADLLSKLWAVGHAHVVLYDDRPSRFLLRLVGALAAIAVAASLSVVARRVGLGRQWGVWVGCALLVAGIVANGLSSLLWARGVPDFIDLPGAWVWNVADFEIAVGLAGGALSVVVSALVVYLRGQAAPRRAA